jgi:hypothetical protein
LTETLTTWKQVELQRFCQFQCSENICGFESDYKTMKKRQINNNVNINNSTITDSNFFESNNRILFIQKILFKSIINY